MKIRVLLSTVLAFLFLDSLGGGAVSARPQEGIRVTQSQPAEAEYGAMGPGCPACSGRTGAAATLPTAGQCGGSYVWCDAIPVEIVPPAGGSDDRDIFFTIFELHWDGSGGNDLDFKFYDNAQSTGSHELLGSSESTKNPEVIRAANASLEKYHLVVINYSGANTGYKIKARITTDPFQSPSEALAPDPPKRQDPAPDNQDSSAEESIATPPDFSGGGGGDTPLDAPGATLDPVSGIGGDSDFGFGFSDLDDRITVQPDDFAAGGPATALTPTEPVSAAVLLASLVGAPALLVGSGAAFAWKRRRDLLI